MTSIDTLLNPKTELERIISEKFDVKTSLLEIKTTSDNTYLLVTLDGDFVFEPPSTLLISSDDRLDAQENENSQVQQPELIDLVQYQKVLEGQFAIAAEWLESQLKEHRLDSAIEILRERMDKGQGKPCGKGWISEDKVCGGKERKRRTRPSRSGQESAKKDRKTTEFAAKWLRSWRNTPVLLKKLINRLDDPEEIVVPLTIENFGSCFQRPGKGICMDGLDSGAAVCRMIYRHEYGHYLDSKLPALLGTPKDELLTSEGYFSSTKKFNAALRLDEEVILEKSKAAKDEGKTIYAEKFRRYRRNPALKTIFEKGWWYDQDVAMAIKMLEMSKELKTPEAVVQRLESEGGLSHQLFKALPKKDRTTTSALELLAQGKDPVIIAKFLGVIVKSTGAPNDLLGSITKNVVGDGHTLEYYNARPIHAQNTEAFANIVALHGTGHPIVDAVLSELTPNSYRLYKQALEKVK